MQVINTIKEFKENNVGYCMPTLEGYYVELNDKCYILNKDDNKLVKSCNYIGFIENIQISNTVKNYIINLCLSDAI